MSSTSMKSMKSGKARRSASLLLSETLKSGLKPDTK